jgi:hypothetical protein
MILLGILHCLRGRGWLPRWALFLLVALLAYAETMSLLLAAVTTAGIALWIVPGIGKFFSAITGTDNPLETEIRWIDRLGYRLFPRDETPATNKLRGTVCMSLRGLYLYPLFLAYAFWNPWALLTGLLCLLQGPVYYLSGRLTPLHAVALAELLVGTLFGLMITLTV